MFKRAVLRFGCGIFLLVSSLAVLAEAGDYDFIRGASIGYLSTYSSPAVFFNANPGDRIGVIAIPSDYATTEGYCGLARMGDPNILASGYSNTYIYHTVAADDLYLFTCIKVGGPSGDIVMGSVDLGISAAMAESQKNVDRVVDQSIRDRLQREIDSKIAK